MFFADGAPLTAAQREQLVARAIGVVDEPVLTLAVEEDTLLVDLGCNVGDKGWVLVDAATGATSVPGVWAAGNAANPRAQVVTAAGEWFAAAIAINNSLVEEDLATAVMSFRLSNPMKEHHVHRRPPPASSHRQGSGRSAQQAPARRHDLGRGLPDPTVQPAAEQGRSGVPATRSRYWRVRGTSPWRGIVGRLTA